MTSNLHANKQVPADFPRSCGGSVSGVQNKLSVRKIDGRFVDGTTEEELWVRYDACVDLATKLTKHAKAKYGQYAELSVKEFLRRFRAGVVRRGWDIAPAELDWVMGRVTLAIGGSTADIPGQTALDAKSAIASPASTNHRVETLVDRVRVDIARRQP